MNKIQTMLGATLVVVMLVAASVFSLHAIGSMVVVDANVDSASQTLDGDFLAVDAARTEGQVAGGAEDESTRTLNDWTFTGRNRFSRGH